MHWRDRDRPGFRFAEKSNISIQPIVAPALVGTSRRDCLRHAVSFSRIVIIGRPGGGKSTLARAIGGRMGLPVVHLDRLFWLPGWVAVDRATFRRRIADALAGGRWVVEGNYPGALDLRLPRADLLVEVELPRARCIARLLWRACRHRGRDRADRPDGCPERFNRRLLARAWHFGRDTAPKLEKGIARHGPGVHRIRLASDREMAAFLAGLEAG